MTRPIAVTGAGGYLGGRLVLHLAAAGIPVRALVRDELPWLDRDGVEQVTGDISDVGEARAVVHLAAPNEVAAAADPAGTTAAAVATAHDVAAAAAAAGADRMVLASTVHVYGARIVDGARLTEDLRCEPRHPYAVARLASEHIAATALAGANTDLVVLRFTNGVGAAADPSVDRWTLLVNDLARQAATEGRLVLRTHGLQWRDFVPVADLCRIVSAACEGDRVPPGTYNAGSGTPRTVRDVAGLVADAVEERTGVRPELVAPEPDGAPPEPHVVDVARLRACGALGDPTPLEDAVAETVAFCLAPPRPSLSTGP